MESIGIKHWGWFLLLLQNTVLLHTPFRFVRLGFSSPITGINRSAYSLVQNTKQLR